MGGEGVTLKLVRVDEKTDKAKKREILEENQLYAAKIDIPSRAHS